MRRESQPNGWRTFNAQWMLGAAFLGQMGVTSALDYHAGVDQTLDDLARHLETHLDVTGLLALAGV